MKRNVHRAAFVALATLTAPLALSQSATAALSPGGLLSALPSVDARALQARGCSQAVGPFQTQGQAYQAMLEVQAQGYGTGPVYGQDGLYSNYSNRRWYFTVYYAC